MRGSNNAVKFKQGTLRARFLDEHVYRHARNPLLFERLDKRLFVNKPAAGTVDNSHCWLDQGKLFCPDDAPCLVIQRNMQGNKISLLQQLVQGDNFNM